MRIPIVDEQDNLLYFKDQKDRDLRREITRGSALWLVNEKREALLAKRSKNKKSFPNVWGPSAAGGVDEGESYLETIIRETGEEIGIKLEDLGKGPKERESDNNEFFAQYFFTKISSNTEFVLEESEVDEVRWISIPALEKWFYEHREEFIPTFNSSLKVLKNYAAQS